MNHPQDYMVDYRDSQSSDSSSPHICYQKHTAHTSSNKNKSLIEAVKPKKKESVKRLNKKQTNSIFHNRPAKKKNKKEKEKQAKFDIFVYGESFYNCENIDEISNRFKQRQKAKQVQKVMMDHRLRRKEKICIQKIQKYLRGFLVTQLSPKRKIQSSQKFELYNILKKEQQEKQEQNLLEQIIRTTLETLQQKCEGLVLIYPTQSDVINRWKNVKMHQLMTAQQFLLQADQLNLDIFNLNKELQLLKQQEFFPQMRQEAHQLQDQIIKHIQTQSLRNTLKLEDEMVIWVLNRFLSFIQSKEDIWISIAQTLEQYQCNYKKRPLITNQIYVQFQKSQIGQQEEYEGDQPPKIYLHLFNKAVFDLINEVAFQLSDVYPAIECMRQIIGMAKAKLTSEQLTVCFQNSLLEIDNMIFEQLLEDFLTDFLDFL